MKRTARCCMLPPWLRGPNRKSGPNSSARGPLPSSAAGRYMLYIGRQPPRIQCGGLSVKPAGRGGRRAMTEPSSRSARPPRGGRGATRLSLIRTWLLRVLAALLAWQGLSLVLPGVLAVNLANGERARDSRARSTCWGRAVLRRPSIPTCRSRSSPDSLPGGGRHRAGAPVPHPPFVAPAGNAPWGPPLPGRQCDVVCHELLCLVTAFVCCGAIWGNRRSASPYCSGHRCSGPGDAGAALRPAQPVVLVLLVACWAAARADRQPLAGDCSPSPPRQGVPSAPAGLLPAAPEGRAVAWFAAASAALALARARVPRPGRPSAPTSGTLSLHAQYLSARATGTIIAATLRSTLGSASLRLVCR